MMIHQELPKDRVMLLSVINTKLRDRYETLDSLCEDMDIKKETVVQELLEIDYEYDVTTNQFI